ncbi:MAG: hypothetical protein EXQ53_08610 [Acidobacteria bacterium]|nr:hypothetical protein [Acidobacteriota bacterium]
MPVRLNITMDEDLYRRLKRDVPPKGISAFISHAGRARIYPGRKALDDAYKAASTEAWRHQMAGDWGRIDTDGWPGSR